MTKRLLAVVLLMAACACAGAQVRTKGAQPQAQLVEPDPAETLTSWDG